MSKRAIRRIPATEAKTHFGRIVQEVAASGTPVVIQTRGQDQAAIVRVDDLERLSRDDQKQPMDERERARAALRRTGLLVEPTPEMRRRAKEYEARHTPEDRARILSELRGLRLEPSLSDVILRSRDWHPSPEQSDED